MYLGNDIKFSGFRGGGWKEKRQFLVGDPVPRLKITNKSPKFKSRRRIEGFVKFPVVVVIM
jgi:hypothetical protein